MRQRFALTLFAVAALSLPAAAQEHEAVALSPFAGDLGNAVWTLVIFVIVVIVLGKFAWGPVLGLLRQREEFIHKSLSDAKHDRDQAEARLKDTPRNCRAPRLKRRGFWTKPAGTPSASVRSSAAAQKPRPRHSSPTPSGRFNSKHRAPSSRSATRPWTSP